jgi:hypothetical protein
VIERRASATAARATKIGTEPPPSSVFADGGRKACVEAAFGSWRGGGVVSAGGVAFSPSGNSDQSLVGLWFGASAACAAPAPVSAQATTTAAVDRQAEIRRIRSRRESADAAVALFSTPTPMY